MGHPKLPSSIHCYLPFIPALLGLMFLPSIVTSLPFFSPKKTIISTLSAPQAIGPYSQAVLSPDKKTLYISGCIGLSPKDQKMVPGGVSEQTAQALKNLVSILEAAGGKVCNVVKTSVLVADIKDYKAVNVVYNETFKESKPARSAFAVKDLPAGALVEIEAIACFP
jgi:2-iminobutanoate/2-iminopropanoate deaminase